ncbi:MAG: NAD(P)H-binding protein [Gemmatimonadetes bacterium]|nr:NAD(P)H-binding protein [Gemmatimonadota bacterium]
MRVLLFGASGMIGSGVLHECLADPRVTRVTAVVRAPLGRTDPKLREVLHQDFTDYAPLAGVMADADACFFCLGVSAVGLDEAAYTRLTHDLTLTCARAQLAANRDCVFCYVSGQGTDSTERGRAMWARVKGRTENALLALGFRAAYMFRPGFIQPMAGVRSKTGWYQAIYTVMAPLSPLLTRVLPGVATTSVRMARAMITVAISGFPSRVVTTRDINALGA